MAGFPLRVALLIVAVLVPVLAGCGDDPTAPELEGDNLLQLIASSEDLELIESIVSDLSLTATLRTGTELTFFAPTDDALLSLGDEMVGRLRAPANREILNKLIRRHLVPGRIRRADLVDGTTLTPLTGPPLPVRVDGEDLFVGEALVDEDAFETGNGVLYFLDEVVRDHFTLAERLRVTPLVTAFADALATAGLDEVVASGETYTLLIPINSAFEAIPPPELVALLSNANRSVLDRVLRHHILPGRVTAADLASDERPDPLDGTALGVVAEDGLLFVDGARVIVPEIPTSNGLIYLLDEVVTQHLDLADRMQILPQYFTSFSILRDAGLLARLRDADPVTVFAPPEAAWTPLGIPFLPELRDRPDLLERTAQSLVVAGRVDEADLLTGDDLTTLGGDLLPITVREDVGGADIFIGPRAQVRLPAREAYNGLVYEINPYNVPPGVDLEESALFTALYRFLNLAERAGLTSLLQDEEEYTVFAPTDDALEGVGIPDAQVESVFRSHLVAGRFAQGDLFNGQQLTTTTGTELVITVIPAQSSNAGTYVNGFRIETSGTATNGALYAIGGVLPSN